MVNKSKKQHLYRTAMVWLKKHIIAAHKINFRFDVISIEKDENHIELLKNRMMEEYKAN